MKNNSFSSTVVLAGVIAAFASLSTITFGDQDSDKRGAVYTSTNSPIGNSIVEYARGENGSLTYSGEFPTGGLGTGAGLGSQGAVTLSEDNRFLFTVNAGSNNVSVFRVKEHGLNLVGNYASGGSLPISVTQHGDLLYVLNAGAPNTVTGFTVKNNGALVPVANSTRQLSGVNVGPGQVGFSPDGDLLVVTEKGTSQIDTFVVKEDGTLGTLKVSASSGITPFGFGFGHRGQLFVSEAFGGAANASALSSYGSNWNGELNLISASVATHQTAACWTLVSKDGRFAYTTNAGSSSVSGYWIRPNGMIGLLDADGVTATTGDNTSPTDIAQTVSGRFVYVLTGRTVMIDTYRVGTGGTLNPLPGVNLPASMVGLAAR